jgi:hypothetical protein
MLLCRQFLGWGPRNPSLSRGVVYLTGNLPPKDKNNYLFLYVVTVNLHLLNRDAWKTWKPGVQNLVKEAMTAEGEQLGSWSAGNVRLAATCLALLTLEAALEVPYATWSGRFSTKEPL